MTADTLFAGLLVLCIPWIALEGASRLLVYASSRSGSAILTGVRGRSAKGGDCTTRLSRGTLWVKVETARLNNLPEYLLNRLLKPPSRRRLRNGNPEAAETAGVCRQDGHIEGRHNSIQRGLELFYDTGSVFAGFALLCSIAFLVWGAFDLVDQISQLNSRRIPSDSGEYLSKRAFPPLTAPTSDKAGWSPSIVPLIPGLTLPWSHLLPLVVALFFTQIVHEAGHAISGALQAWQPLCMGFLVLFPCIPGAFVTLPNDAVMSEGQDDDDFDHEVATKYSEQQDRRNVARKRLRNISAGVWHNAVTALCLAWLLYTGVGSSVHKWFSTEVNGLLVESVDESSPLLEHLSSGTIITRLDDVDLTSSTQRTAADRQRIWNSYLLDETADRGEKLGWCVPRSLWVDHPTSCCEKFTGKRSEDIAAEESLCFHLLDEGSILSSPGRCFDPIRLVSTKYRQQRCRGKCPNERECIISDEREKLLRITVEQQQQSTENSTRVVLFQGNLRAVFTAVTVTTFRFRLGWIVVPYWLISTFTLLFSYILNLSLAMALFNMLPLPSLDGDVYARVVLRAAVDRLHLANRMSRSGEDIDQEEEAGQLSMHIGVRMTTRAVSPTQLRRQSLARLTTSSEHRQDCQPSSFFPTRKHVDVRTLAKVHRRIQWFTMILAVFVFGGSILLHAVKDLG